MIRVIGVGCGVRATIDQVGQVCQCRTIGLCFLKVLNRLHEEEICETEAKSFEAGGLSV